MKIERSKEWWVKMAEREMPIDEKERERQRQLRDAHERIGDLGRYINELEESLQWERATIHRLKNLLKEAAKYIADAGGDEDPETQANAAELLEHILIVVDPTTQPPR